MEIEIVRHDGGTENADGDVEHFAIAEDLGVWNKAVGGFEPKRTREEDFVGEAGGDGEDEGDDERFEHAEAAALKEEDDENIESGENDAEKKRNVKEELERDGGAEDFGEVASGDGDFADDPKKDGGEARVSLATGLGEIAAGDDAELGGERLQEHCHEIAEKNDAEERVAELRAALKVGGPIARVHITDGDEVTGAGEGEKFAEPGGGRRDGNGAMRFGQGGRAGRRLIENGRGGDGVGEASHC